MVISDNYSVMTVSYMIYTRNTCTCSNPLLASPQSNEHRAHSFMSFLIIFAQQLFPASALNTRGEKLK